MSYTNPSVLFLIPIIISVALILFVLWMFRDMLRNDYIVGNMRVIWIIGFVFASVLAAGYYYFTEYRLRQ